MSLFTKKPTTVTAIFDKAVAEVRVIQDAQVAKQKVLKEEQAENVKILDAEIAALETKREVAQNSFKEKSAANEKAAVAAEKERMLAGTVVQKFADLFGVKAK